MEKEKYDYLIVGSGLFGSTFAHLANKMGKRCLMIEKRPQVGGNLYCENIEGINVHKYGAHIFHTNNKRVWDFVNRFVEFNRFTNCPLANYNGKLYNLPFNMNTFHQIWGVLNPADAKRIINQQIELTHKVLDGRIPANLEEQALSLVGEDIYRILIKEYTEKQWGRDCSKLPSFIIKRLPVRFVYDNNYFKDRYQGVPVGGYNRLIDGLLKNIEYRLNEDFFPIYQNTWRTIAKKLVYTGPLDEYFGYKEGRLDWRTVSFEIEIKDVANYQGNAVVNYTSKKPEYTRIIEHKHFEMFGEDVELIPKTVISKEYSKEYEIGMEPYYPINDYKNNSLAELYRDMAKEEKDVIFGGRLAQYRYFDMAPIIEQVLYMFDHDVL